MAEMVDVYRHDAHKFTGVAHGSASETFAGVSVNKEVPHGADRDAAALSRPFGEQSQTVPTHGEAYRLSLLTGDSEYDPRNFSWGSVEGAAADLLTIDDAEAAHKAWLTSDLAAAFNESVYHPYTSLKYHTLLVAALVDAYESGESFEELRLVVDDADRIVPHRTVYRGEEFSLRLSVDADGDGAARLGSKPWRSWASTWNRMTAHPLDTSDKWEMTLDANLRRIQSWSTALQYIEDFTSWEAAQ